jgi:hypothetical protein
LKRDRDFDIAMLAIGESVLVQVNGKDCVRLDCKERPKMDKVGTHAVTFYDVLGN